MGLVSPGDYATFKFPMAGEDGNYPENTVNGMVQKKLAAMAENMRQFSQGSEQGGQSES
ncbi:MAG: hypothetical protein R6U97_02455 [Desulfosalsimonas sp.]